MLECKKCGGRLNWEDTVNFEGGILEGYLLEEQIYICENCNTNYNIQARVNFRNNEIEFDEPVEE